MSATRNNSATSVSTTGSYSKERRSSSISKAFKTVGHKIAEHHRDVNAAYEAYYGSSSSPARRTSKVAAPVIVLSEEDQILETAVPQKSTKSSLWSKVKQHAKEHHEGVNGAFDAYYGRTSSSHLYQ